jgi:hypothetical protein
MTTPISTTAAYSDVVVDPLNPLVVYCAVGDQDGDAANGVYKSVNGGASWNSLGNFPLQHDLRLGRITLAISPNSTQVLYASVAASGQLGTTVGNHQEFVRSPDGGTSWAGPHGDQRRRRDGLQRRAGGRSVAPGRRLPRRQGRQRVDPEVQ